jgi:hypothetical protein
MPAMTSLVLTDRSTPTPVDKTFVPVRQDPASGVWTLRQSGTANTLEAAQLTVSARESGGKYRARFVLRVPIVQTETINGVNKPMVARTGFAEVSFTIDMGASPQERKDLVSMIRSALDANELLDQGVTDAASFF